MSEPTPGELLRRLEDNTAYLNRISTQVREDRDRADMRYVPRVEWVEARRGIGDRIDDVADDVADLKRRGDADAGFRRQVLLAFAVAAFSALVSVAVAIIVLVFGR